LIETLGKARLELVLRAPRAEHGPQRVSAGLPRALAREDLRICHDMAARHGVLLPVVEMTLLHYRKLIAQGHGDEDISTIFRLKDALFAAAGQVEPGPNRAMNGQPSGPAAAGSGAASSCPTSARRARCSRSC